MNSPTCLLCGKNLNRIRAGGGGDFCSLEHRSQYHLLRGMDRLGETPNTSMLFHSGELPRPLAQPAEWGTGEKRMQDLRSIRITGHARELVFQPILPRAAAPRPVPMNGLGLPVAATPA